MHKLKIFKYFDDNGTCYDLLIEPNVPESLDISYWKRVVIFKIKEFYSEGA